MRIRTVSPEPCCLHTCNIELDEDLWKRRVYCPIESPPGLNGLLLFFSIYIATAESTIIDRSSLSVYETFHISGISLGESSAAGASSFSNSLNNDESAVGYRTKPKT